MHSDASQIRLASSLRASWLGFRSPLQAVFSFSRACSGHFTQASLHKPHVRLMVCYQASTEMRAGSDSQRASTGSGFSCHVFQAFPGEACSERTLLEGAAGGCLRTAPIPQGLLFLKKRKKNFFNTAFFLNSIFSIFQNLHISIKFCKKLCNLFTFLRISGNFAK